MSKYLLDDKSIIILPTLAVKIGLNESIMLQQMHYWLLDKKNPKDGYYWVYNSYQSWVESDFPFWSHSTVKRVIKSLEDKELVISVEGLYNKRKGDKTKWYRINYQKFNELFDDVEPFDGTVKEENHSGQNDQSENNHSGQNEFYSGQNDQSAQVNMTRPLPKISPKISIKNNNDDFGSDKPKEKQLSKIEKQCIEIRDYYNSFERLKSVAPGRGMSPKRVKMLSALLEKYSMEEIKEAIEKLAISKQWLLDQEWFDFNWMYKDEKNFECVLEGKYVDKQYSNYNTNAIPTGTQYAPVNNNLYGDVME